MKLGISWFLVLRAIRTKGMCSLGIVALYIQIWLIQIITKVWERLKFCSGLPSPPVCFLLQKISLLVWPLAIPLCCPLSLMIYTKIVCDYYHLTALVYTKIVSSIHYSSLIEMNWVSLEQGLVNCTTTYNSKAFMAL